MRVRRAARRVLKEKGLHASMEEIADTAGVGRRSLFRHFDSRDGLVAEALAEALDEYHALLATETASDSQQPDQPLEQWLELLATRFHRAVVDVGLGYWQLAAAEDGDLTRELAALNRRRREARKTSSAAIARQAWRRAGGQGVPPKVVVDAVALTFSTFATRSMVDDYGTTPAIVARATARMLTSLIEFEVTHRAPARPAAE
jgi:AcrR family transcriptional regulator